MTVKLQFTAEILALLKQAHERNHTMDSVYQRLWRNLRQDGGMRLSEEGVALLQSVGRSGIVVETGNTGILRSSFQLLLDCDRRCPCPYYIGSTFLLYDEREAVVFALAGSLKQYLVISRRPY